MFDVGFPELLVVGVVTLLILGPERLPEVLRTLGRWIGQARRSFNSLKNEIEREIGADEIRRELHNTRILEQTRDAQASIRAVGDDIEEALSSARAQSRQALEEARTGIFQDSAGDAEDTATTTPVIQPPDTMPSSGEDTQAPSSSEDDPAPAAEKKHGS